MPILTPKRVFLDTWVLNRLADDEWPGAFSELVRRIRDCSWQVIVTYDHVFDWGSDSNRERAQDAARFVRQRLDPLWMLCGGNLLRLEAYREFCREAGKPVPQRPWPSRRLHDLWAVMPWPSEVQPSIDAVKHISADLFVDGAVESWFALDDRERRLLTAQLKALFNANRLWARQKGVAWSKHAALVWRRHLAEWAASEDADPALKWNDDRLPRMPGWEARFAVEKIWHSNPQRQPKPGDYADMNHLALLPYVDSFVSERNLGGMIRQAKLHDYEQRVFRKMDEWVAST